jgi:carbon-monoxide dehydrogenase medium subunit
MLPPFEIHRAEDLSDALARIDDDRIPYWGGTELLLAMKMGLLRPEGLVDLKRVPRLRDIRVDGDRLVIGAGCSHDEVARHELVREHVPVLAAAESGVGNARVRAQGTIGGNLAFAEPRSDVATVLAALGASVRLVSSSGERSASIEDFVLGPYWTLREPNELVVDIAVPLPAPRGIYRKFQTVERPTAAVAIVRPTGDRGESRARLVIGAVTERPQMWDVPDLHAVDPESLARDLEPVPDLTGSVRYKRHVTGVLVRRAIAALDELERLEESA